jgi:hypothetical protein
MNRAVMAWVMLIAAGCSSPVPTFPEPSKVRRMEALVGNSWRELPETTLFEVPAEHIPKIMAGLAGYAPLQGERRYMPGLGDLLLHCDDGKTVRVSLYHSYGLGPCIYCVQGGTGCYSGGSDREVDDAIRAAYQDSLKNSPP